MKLNFFTLIISLLLLSSCNSKKIIISPQKTTTQRKSTVVKNSPTIVKTKKKLSKIDRIKTPQKSTPTYGSYAIRIENYVNQYAEIAMEQMRQYKIPASITLAQGILESGAGTGKLTLKANNHFGIKCHNWKGQKVYHDDDKSQECFRKYSNAQFSFQDHSLFLTTRSRYFSLFQLAEDDYKKWAKGLRAAGYATDPKYPSKLIGIIEKYKLYNYDAKVLGKSPKNAKKISSKSDQYTVKKGDTLYSIARKNKIKVAELKALNSLDGNTIHQGQILYVKPLPTDY